MSSEPPRLPDDSDAERADVRGAVEADVVAVIALGGAIGSLGRWGLGEVLPHPAGAFGWSTFLVNVTGAFALGVLMAQLAGRWAHTRLVRPLLGVGVLGGWTTFSAYALDARDLLADDRVTLGLGGYLAGTLVAGLLAVAAGVALGRAVAGEPR